MKKVAVTNNSFSVFFAPSCLKCTLWVFQAPHPYRDYMTSNECGQIETVAWTAKTFGLYLDLIDVLFGYLETHSSNYAEFLNNKTRRCRRNI